ncbi:MAG: hypothetical protein HYZ25_20725 [Chloroflexi bacterium]|nr:hypothetical protein [Chloroflexota bacterium]
MTTQNEERDVFATHCFDPFPEPQTIPAGWDTSVFSATSQSTSAMEEDDSAQG